MNKVRHGTPVHDGPSLCRSCRSATIVSGTSLNDELVICGELSRPYDRIRFKVTDCSGYDNKATPTIGMMQQIAWELRTDRSGQRIGFMGPREATKRRDEIEELPYLDEPEVIRRR